MKAAVKEAETLLIEEDGTANEKMKESKKSELDSWIKILRKDRELGKNEIIREFLMPIALYVAFSLLIRLSRKLTCSPECRQLITKSAGACSSWRTFSSGLLKRRHRR